MSMLSQWILSQSLLYRMRDLVKVISTFSEMADLIGKVILHDELEMDVSQMVNIDQLKIVNLLNTFGVFIIESLEEIQLVSTSELSRYLAYVNDVFQGTISPVMVESDLVDLLFSFNVLIGFYLLL